MSGSLFWDSVFWLSCIHCHILCSFIIYQWWWIKIFITITITILRGELLSRILCLFRGREKRRQREVIGVTLGDRSLLAAWSSIDSVSPFLSSLSPSSTQWATATTHSRRRQFIARDHFAAVVSIRYGGGWDTVREGNGWPGCSE